MASNGLNVNDVVNVTISLSAVPAAFRNFGACMVVGSSNVIDVSERKRTYTSINGVASDFGTTAPEYLWAQNFFSQSPQPSQLAVGRWAQAATAGVLHGAALTPALRLMSLFTAITSGGMSISIDGAVKALTGMNFSAQPTLNGVASVVQAALVAAGATGATVVWNSNYNRFDVLSGTTGAASAVSYATTPGSGTDVSVLMGLSATANSSGSSATPPIAGIVAEAALSCINNLANFGDWYAVAFAPLTPFADSDALAVAGFIEAAGVPRVFGHTTQNTAAMDSTQTSDIGYILHALGYQKTMASFSQTNLYLIASIFGRFATVNYNGSATTITLKFKIMPGTIAEYINEAQAAALDAKFYNYYVNYQNGTAILQQGVMASGIFIDSRVNADWLANYTQTNAYNLIRGATTKIPQTDAGMNLIKTNISASLQQGVVNGYLAPGIWNATGFGTLQQGDPLPLGYYVYAPLVASQAQSDRAARKSVPFQVAAKEAGAVHSANIAIVVNP